RDRLGKAKTEAADAVGLRKQILELKAVAATKLDEVASLTVRNAELSGIISRLEFVGYWKS
ncbi:hypothetical protein Tco_0532074, partial [Tanacetum coccineum]